MHCVSAGVEEADLPGHLRGLGRPGLLCACAIRAFGVSQIDGDRSLRQVLTTIEESTALQQAMETPCADTKGCNRNHQHMKNLLKRSIAVALPALIGFSSNAIAQTYCGVTLPNGPQSFADGVVSYSVGSYAMPPFTTASHAIGIPQCGSGSGRWWENTVSLGNYGELILEFTDNRLTPSGDNSVDLWVFEVGSGTEHVDVSISLDGNQWIYIGRVTDGTNGLDIDAVVGGGPLLFPYVKLVDVGNNFYTGSWAGADIEAVAAVSTEIIPFTSFCFGQACPCGNDDSAGAGCQNQTGSGALMTASGSNSASSDDLTMITTSLPPNAFGIMFMASSQDEIVFGDGLRCVDGALFRYGPPQNSGSTGTLSWGPGLISYSCATFSAGGCIEASSTWNFQTWYRDNSGPCGTGFNTSNAVSVAFVP
ncbi:MAG: hypothetical protein ACI8X5_003327 [Planctomycetota bacterium]|jgi:hypothetical protein